MRWAKGKFITSWPEPRRSPHGDIYDPSIYFVSAGGLTKIGYAEDPFRRICELSVGCPVPLLLEAYAPGSIASEKRLHKVFATYRMHNEWFRQNVLLRALLNELELVKTDREARAEVVRRWTR